MNEHIRQAMDDEIEALFPLLLLAERWAPALRWGLAHMVDAVYQMDDPASGAPIAAATLQWRGDTAEIIELAVDPNQQGRGVGRSMIEWIIAEARHRSKIRLIVGTPSVSAGNIIFYQKCGFRPHEIRRDYFSYYRTPILENGLPLRDMLVFSYDLTPAAVPGTRRAERGR